MKRSADKEAADDQLAEEAQAANGGFLRRWARRKERASAAESEIANPKDDTIVSDPGEALPAVAEPPPAVLTDADMPSIESLDENSDYSPFFSPGVSEDLRRVALRKLFRSASFNELCPLEGEYHDCRGYEALGSVVTHEMRSQLEREAAELAKRAQAAVEETIKETMESPPTHSPSGGQPSPAPGLRAGSKPERTGQTAARKATRPTSARAKRKRSERC